MEHFLLPFFCCCFGTGNEGNHPQWNPSKNSIDILLPTLWKRVGDDPFVFQQNCWPVRKARSIMTQISVFGVKELFWPDLNSCWRLSISLKWRMWARPPFPTSVPDLRNASIRMVKFWWTHLNLLRITFPEERKRFFKLQCFAYPNHIFYWTLYQGLPNLLKI